MNNQIKTPEQILSEHSKNYGAIEHNPRAVVKASEALDAMKEYAKELLEEYTNRIVENVHLTEFGCRDNRITNENAGQSYFVPSYFGEDNEVEINKESITSQLPKFLKEKGLCNT